MASHLDGFLRQLRRRGYSVPDRPNGTGHLQVWHGETLVAVASGTRHGGRGFANFRSEITRYEQGRATVRVRRGGRAR